MKSPSTKAFLTDGIASQESDQNSARRKVKTQSSVRERIWRYAPLLFWIALISFASTGEFSAMNTSRVVRPLLLWLFPNITEKRILVAHLLVRKAAHLTEYAVLGWLAARAFVSSSRELLRRHWFFAGILLVIFQASLDEYHQSFVPTRTASPYDSVIDIAGGLIGLIGFAYLQNRKSKHLPRIVE